jgi:hypothetical protein
MSHVIPEARAETGQSIDLEPLNRTMQWFANEINGQLNEHNWAANAVTGVTDVEAGAIVRVSHAYQECDPGIGQANPLPVTVPANGFKISSSMQWVTITTLELTKDWDETTLVIMGSLQIGSSTPGGAQVLWGLQLAVSIDNSPLMESVTGSMDNSNDTEGEGMNSTRLNSPFVIEVVEPILAGTHTVTIQARTIRDEGMTVPANDDYYMALNRELIILELW